MKVSKNKLQELQTIITKMSLEVCCVAVIPEFGVKWRDVSQAVRNARLPMLPASVARVLCRYAAMSLPVDELEDILGRLRIKLEVTQSRSWHAVLLSERKTDDSPAVLMRTVHHRVLTAMRNGKHRNMRPQVQSVTLGELMYLSVQLVSESCEGGVLYVCWPPGSPLVLMSCVTSTALLKGVTEGLGYARFEVLMLNGKDIPSLLRIADRAWAAETENLSSPLEYQPIPTLLANGIDYTNKTYDEEYVDCLLGSNPPLLTDLNIKSTRMFFDKSRLDKTINLSVTLKSDNVSETLKSWMRKKTLAPTSDFFQIYHQIKSNRIQYIMDDSD